MENINLRNTYGEAGHCSFGHLEPRYRDKISIYVDGKLSIDYYREDLNEIVKRTHNQYFIDRIPVKLVSSCGHVEYIGGNHV